MYTALYVIAIEVFITSLSGIDVVALASDLKQLRENFFCINVSLVNHLFALVGDRNMKKRNVKVSCW